MTNASNPPFEAFAPRRLTRAAHAEQPSHHEEEVRIPNGESAPPVAVPPQHSPACDRRVCAAALRERAIRLAGQACARALHEAIARNPLFVARFVDDALRVSGDATDASVRLRPEDAQACAGRVRCDIVADGALSPGEVVVESNGGSIRATLDERAHALVRAAADA